MLAQIDWSLGRFGDLRLDKGGRRSSNAWSRARMSACDGWQEACVPGRCASTAFSAMPAFSAHGEVREIDRLDPVGLRIDQQGAEGERDAVGNAGLLVVQAAEPGLGRQRIG